MPSAKDRFRAWKQGFRPTDISTPENRRRAETYTRWFDHGAFRNLWHNKSEFAPGAWRSNHPDGPRLERLAAEGIRTIISLRGDGRAPWQLLEAEDCARLGLTLLTAQLQSMKAPQKAELQKLLAHFRAADRPFLIHCKSGADRTGLAATLYLHVIEGEPLSDARRMLSWRNLHFGWTRTGVLGHLLDTYAADPEGRDFETWLDQAYDPDAVQADFEAR